MDRHREWGSGLQKVDEIFCVWVFEVNSGSVVWKLGIREREIGFGTDRNGVGL